METTQNFTIGQEVTFSGAFGVNVIESITGKTAITKELNTALIYTKRLSSLVAYKQQVAYWGEQELTNPIYQHGDTVFASLSGDGNNLRMVWDDIKKECVTPENLTK